MSLNCLIKVYNMLSGSSLDVEARNLTSLTRSSKSHTHLLNSVDNSYVGVHVAPVFYIVFTIYP